MGMAADDTEQRNSTLHNVDYELTTVVCLSIVHLLLYF